MITPVSSQERIEVLDVLRGLALFGVLVVNFHHGGFVRETAAATLTADHITFLLMKVFAEGKAYSLFAFLFGLGFAVQIFRAEVRGISIVGVYSRRLFMLLLIGWAHWILLWGGDVLNEYAVLGFVLLLFRRCSQRTVLMFAFICLIFNVVGNGRIIPKVLQPDRETSEERQARMRRATRAQREGTYGQVVAVRAEQFSLRYARVSRLVWIHLEWGTLCLFLLGLYAGKRGVFQDARQHTRFLRQIMLGGLIVGLPGSVLIKLGGEGYYRLPDLVMRVCHVIGTRGMFLFYAAAVTLFFQREHGRKLLTLLAPVGRMALTNYVAQSFVLTTLFYGYGFGLNKVGASTALILAVVIFLLQVGLSTWWLRRFRFGPLEWVWRSLTYGQLQPQHLPATKAVAAEAQA